MTTNARASAGRALLLAAFLVGAGCTFPDYILPGETVGSTTSSAGGAAASTSSTQATSTSTGAGGGGGTTTSTTGSTMGPICTQPCDPSNGATCTSACDGSSDPACDCDGDGEIVDTPACKAAHPGALVDCYDCNPGAKHGVTEYFIHDRGDGKFDFDCSNLDEPQYDTACGETALTCSKPFRYDATPGCGKNGLLFACTAPTLQTCKKAAMGNQTPQACH